MKTEINIYSRNACEHLVPDNVPHVIISVSTPGSPPADLKSNRATLEILRLWFHDMDRWHPDVNPGDIKLFSVEQANQVWDLLCRNPDLQRVVVHCDAGLSRSPGIGAAIAKILHGSDTEFFRRYHPNMLVYRTLLQAHHDRMEAQELKEGQDGNDND